MRCLVAVLAALGMTACSTGGAFAPAAQASVAVVGDGFLVNVSGSSPQAVMRLAGKKANSACLQQGKKVGDMRRVGASDQPDEALALEPRLEGELYTLRARFRCVDY
ncbi:hypothetical protein CEK28_04425 [Xenophilus sp. AP218F]|nr:hypothetical protein CEK28_04425 [Xenophilus sp. AP218F]